VNKKLLRENRIHGDTMFPLGIYTMNRISGQNHLDFHWHDELEFLYVTEGSAIFQVDISSYKVSAGEALFINSGKIHAGYAQEEPGCTYCAVVFNPSLLMGSSYDALQVKFLDPLLTGKYATSAHIKGTSEWDREILAHIGAIMELGLAKQFTYELQIKGHLYLVFSFILSNNALNITDNKPSANIYKAEKLKEILQYIQNNYYRKITIRELASRLNMSEGHFCRFFKQMLKRKPIDYINYYRVSMAAKLLADSRKKIIEVAMDVGFDNCSYFINIFKGYMKCTPSEYRRNNCSS
jgi:AraC-like DNA-binding protein